jgi:hypothetical protein
MSPAPYLVRAFAPFSQQWTEEPYWTLGETLRAQRELEAMGFTQITATD